jgi:hypothetical protein
VAWRPTAPPKSSNAGRRTARMPPSAAVASRGLSGSATTNGGSKTGTIRRGMQPTMQHHCVASVPEMCSMKGQEGSPRSHGPSPSATMPAARGSAIARCNLPVVQRSPGLPAERARLSKHSAPTLSAQGYQLDGPFAVYRPPPVRPLARGCGGGKGGAPLGGLCRAPWTSRTADASQPVHRDTDISRYRTRSTVPWTGRSYFRRSALYAPPAEKTQTAPIEHPPRLRRWRHAQYQQPFEVL